MSKARYSQSRISQYFRCPKAFDLYGEHEPDIADSTKSLMRDGLLFEYYLFKDFVTNEKFTGEFDEATLVGKKKDATINGLKSAAEFCSSFFTNGQSYVKLNHEGEHYDLTGEADFMGDVNFVDSFGEIHSYKNCIADVKLTKGINKVWDDKIKKEDYLQSYMYPYIHWLNTGDLLPFVYIVVQIKDGFDPFTRAIEIHHTERELISWFKPLLEHLHFSFEKKPKYYDPGACIGHKYKNDGPCWFLRHCDHGRSVVGGHRRFAGFQLDTEFDPELHER